MEKLTNIMLSIGILVSNRKDTIRKCMEGLRPLLENLPSELIVVDTVGEENSDGSLAIAKEYATKVIRFEWCNDFAAARNAGLFEARGEWFMFIDDDEWFEDIGEVVDFFNSGEYKKYRSAYFGIRNYSDNAGNYSVGVVYRMVERETSTKFVSPIHEYLTPMKHPQKAFSCQLHHQGYVFATEEKKKERSYRNLSLLEPEFEKKPWDMHLRTQLIQEYMCLEEKEEKGRALCEETIEKIDKKLYKTKEFQWILLSYVRQANRKKEYEELLERAAMIRGRFPMGVVADYAICVLEATAYYNLEQYEKGIEKIKDALYKKKYIQENPEVFEEQRILDIETFTEDGIYSEMLRFGILCQRKSGMNATEWTGERFRHMTIPVLSVSLLVTNRKDTIKTCLDSIKPLLEAIPSELIVVDTVGEENSDGSLAIAKEYADKLVNFSWSDDFAAARNAGLKEAKGEWFLYFDDDEWFENVEDIIQFFISGEYLEYNSATYRVRNYQDAAGSVYSDAVVSRMIHRAKNSEFVGCVNEIFNNIYTPCKSLDSYVHHYGFVYATPEAKQARMQYTLKLLQEDLVKYPANLRNRLQLAIVLSVKNPLQAVALCEETLEVCKEKKESEMYLKIEQLLNGLYAKGVKAQGEQEKAPLLSISLLVSNNIDTVEKCMKSLQPLLSTIPSELIVVDTVGEENSDGSLAIAKKYATKVVRFDWCNDFAAARNAGLFETRGEWFMFLDDDEWFEDISEITEFFKTGEYLQYNSATYQIRNYTKQNGLEYSEATLGRMTKRTANTRFEGAIHETFTELLLPCKTFSCFVHHYGYAYENEQEKQAHRERNLALLNQVLEKNPLELRYRAQMALELASFNNMAAMAFCEETFQLCAEQKERNDFQWQLSLVFRLHEALNSSLKEAEESYRLLKEKFGFNETAENGICCQMTRISILKDEPERGYPYAVKYFTTLAELQQNATKQQLQMTADFSRYQTTGAYLEMLHFGAYCAYKAKAYPAAWEWYGAMPWEEESYSNQEGFSFAMILYRENPNQKAMLGIIKRLMKNGSEVQKDAVKKKLSEALDMIKQTDTKAGTGTNWMKSDIKLTIGVLVSNNIKTIRNCMESLKPILEAVSSELIVVDTVGEESSDGSIAIAKEYATKVVRFEWCNDFSAARNACIDYARGEWFLYVDDDEWFDNVEEIIAFFNSGECDSYGQAAYIMHNHLPDGTTSPTLMGRFVRRTVQTRFVGKVHEKLNLIYPPCKALFVTAQHTGYCYASEEEKKNHQKRNVTLLEQELEKQGLQPTVCAQMVQELLHVEDTWDKGYKFAMECLPFLVKEQKAEADPNTQWIMFSSVRYFSMLDDREGVLRQAEYIFTNYNLSETVKMAISGVAARCAWLLDKYSLTAQYTHIYLEKRAWLLERQNVRMEQNALDITRFFNDEVYIIVLSIAAMCANRQGKFELANVYWKQMPWEKVNEQEKGAFSKELRLTLDGLKASQKQQKLREDLKELLVLLQMLREAEKCVKECVTTENYAPVQELLQGMQEVAITVGTKLDSIIGEGSEEVSLLELYCEKVWQCNNAGTGEELLDCLRELTKLAIEVEEKIKGRL